MGKGRAREANPDLILRERTSLRDDDERESLLERFPSELMQASSFIKEVRVSKLRILEPEAEEKSSSESHSIVGKLSTVASAKERSKREEDSVTSKLDSRLFLGSLVASTILKASVAGHDGIMRYESSAFDVMMYDMFKFMRLSLDRKGEVNDGFLLNRVCVTV
mmetsp:Transcript_20468/g.50170  ORF Transcript_20468/g.50170 Transcript_20468/m.50170 type:complete len:164 (+) Transcript_20468:412-903(+)